MPVVLLTQGGNTQIDGHPDQCPICHAKISPIARYSNSGNFRNNVLLEVVYQCHDTQCSEFFIAYFAQKESQKFPSLTTTRPIEPSPLTFEESVRQISPAFCTIYEEAHKAEQFGLTEICGVGYRKSVEFLIKDYLIKNRPADKATIETIMLGPCIENYVTDTRIKEVAKRATWLGNDETHYQRRWMDKDLNDLKTMIKLVLHWIDAEYLTEEALRSMPAPSKP